MITPDLVLKKSAHGGKVGRAQTHQAPRPASAVFLTNLLQQFAPKRGPDEPVPSPRQPSFPPKGLKLVGFWCWWVVIRPQCSTWNILPPGLPLRGDHWGLFIPKLGRSKRAAAAASRALAVMGADVVGKRRSAIRLGAFPTSADTTGHLASCR